jgi:NAD(P)-dependent dehydrogenase (short-subunit alcohol dehydrogenase family)
MTGLIDRALDWTVVGGFSSIGYAVRSRGWARTPRLDGRRALVTGANSGLGAATCEILAAAGAHVDMVVRTPEKGEKARSGLAPDARERAKVWECDVSSPDSIRRFATVYQAEVDRLDALVNNAGIMTPERTHTPGGVELTFATNVVGPFLLTALLLPVLKAAGGRVVNVSSGGMYTAKLAGDDLQLDGREFDPAKFYAHTKRCEVILSELWQERLAGSAVTAHSAHPGWADTPGVKESLPGFHRVMGPILRDSRQGADTLAWLCWAPEPAADPGRFWHDREPRSTHRVPWTREDEGDRRRLWANCVRLAGIDEDEIIGQTVRQEA